MKIRIERDIDGEPARDLVVEADGAEIADVDSTYFVLELYQQVSVDPNVSLLIGRISGVKNFYPEQEV